MEKEIWKDIPEYEGLYQVSNLGSVKSLINDILLKFGDNGNGYKFVNLSKKGKAKGYYVHRLVAVSFIEVPINKMEINHKDLNKENNLLSNLEWVTKSENQLHRYKHKPSKLKGKFGEDCNVSKRVNQYDLDLNFLDSYCSITVASKETNTNVSSISMVCNGKRKKANNYIWSYEDSTC